jgi:hypothetical protein
MIQEYLQLVIPAVGAVVWLVRLEGKLHIVEKANTETQKDVDDIRIRHEALNTRIVDQLSDIRESLARLEGAISVTKTEGKK